MVVCGSSLTLTPHVNIREGILSRKWTQRHWNGPFVYETSKNHTVWASFISVHFEIRQFQGPGQEAVIREETGEKDRSTRVRLDCRTCSVENEQRWMGMKWMANFNQRVALDCSSLLVIYLVWEKMAPPPPTVINSMTSVYTLYLFPHFPLFHWI